MVAMRSRLSARTPTIGRQWSQHCDGLLGDWRLARDSAPLNRIAPLE